MKHICPICKKTVKVPPSYQKQFEEAKFFPFCSERCKLVDLGGWLDAKYKIISKLPPQEPDKPNEKPSDNPGDKQ